jgi:hypothetical protein
MSGRANILFWGGFGGVVAARRWQKGWAEQITLVSGARFIFYRSAGP